MKTKEARDFLKQLGRRLIFQPTGNLDVSSIPFPEKLYKYKKLDNYALDMIEKDYLYFAPNFKLDDPFELTINYSAKHFDSFFKERYLHDVLRCLFKTSSRHLGSNKATEIKAIYNSIKNRDQIEKQQLDNFIALCCEGLNLNEISSEKLANHLRNFTDFCFQEDTKNFLISQTAIPLLSPYLGICSFSETNLNQPMWSLYADNYNGCCLEYSTEKIKFANAGLYPVVYSDKRTNNVNKLVERQMVNLFFASVGIADMPYKGIDFVADFFLTKSKEWSSQNEWRLLSDISRDRYKHQLDEIGFALKSVYIGIKTIGYNSDNLNKLKILCLKKNINIFVICPNVISLKLDVLPFIGTMPY